MEPGVITIIHTEVPEELGGRGIAATMSKYALEHIAANNLQLIPLCPYMRSYLKKHPEYQCLVKDREEKSV
ncbi:GNAT family N-acetyltransferase [Pontibacter flavimaris]|uniref:GNAT family N-acetyltransferase n=1 Tax=Pontibacter flavimaris TaxID=1797110 RepID=UPI001F17080C|nr:GNAT family N-acetyltransferase [Pontibacter flavimaris]